MILLSRYFQFYFIGYYCCCHLTYLLYIICITSVSGYMVVFNIPRVYRLVFVDKLIKTANTVGLLN